MPVVCLNWETAHLHGDAWISHHRLRYRLFVERQGWEIPTVRDLEHDQFDTPAAQYLLWFDGQNVLRGVARLLPTTHPYMVQMLWPELVAGELPCSAGIWESSRFGCDRSLDAKSRRRAVAEILCAMQEFGLVHGIERYLAVMPVRLLKRVVVNAGCPIELLGPERRLGRLPAAAAYLPVAGSVLDEMRRRARISGSVFRNDISIAA